jgi:hypothetical protein
MGNRPLHPIQKYISGAKNGEKITLCGKNPFLAFQHP